MEKMAGADRVCGGVAESLQYPSLPQLATAVELKRQMGARPKTHTQWLTTQELYWAEEDIGYWSMFQDRNPQVEVNRTHEPQQVQGVEVPGCKPQLDPRGAARETQPTQHWQPKAASDDGAPRPVNFYVSHQEGSIYSGSSPSATPTSAVPRRPDLPT